MKCILNLFLSAKEIEEISNKNNSDAYEDVVELRKKPSEILIRFITAVFV